MLDAKFPFDLPFPLLALKLELDILCVGKLSPISVCIRVAYWRGVARNACGLFYEVKPNSCGN